VVLTMDFAAMVALAISILVIIAVVWRCTDARWEIEERCAHRDCRRPATHERLDGFIGDQVYVELVCRRHGGPAAARRVTR